MLLSLFADNATAQQKSAPPVQFTRLAAHWADYGHPDYLRFVDDAQVEVAQVGFYGGHFWSLAHTEQYGGYPANFPVRGLDEMGDWFERLNGDLHARDVRVVGHFNVEFLVGDPDGPDGPRGFFNFYRELWDESLLGPKPVDDPLDLLEKNANGTPIVNHSYAIGGMSEYWGCLRNPAWRAVLKAWVRQGIRRGVDGFIANYFYRHDCHCEHCQRDFRAYLNDRFSADELRDRFQIDHLERHPFSEIVAWHAPAESTPLRREMLRFSQISNKQAFDEVFVEYGRSLKPDLIVAQWNHLGDFAQIDGDERCLLPAEQWGRDETYAWYSTGDLANRSDLARGVLGEATLQARYVRGAMHGRPYTLGKYENTRIRTAIAELAANGGAPMGFYTNFTDPLARAEIVRYYGFLAKHDAIYRDSEPHAEMTLLFPRRAVHDGNVKAVERFRQLGRRLLDEHVLFDVLPDDDPGVVSLGTSHRVIDASADADHVVAALPEGRSRFETPRTVRVSASRPEASSEQLTLHFVNYNRTEPPLGEDGRPLNGAGIQDERPIPVQGVRVDMKVPDGVAVDEVQFLTPEREAPEMIAASAKNGRLQFELPEFLVYGVVQIRFRQ